MLEIKNLTVKYEKTILENVNLKLDKKIYGLMGMTGSGKTTFIKAVLGLIKYEGEILLNGKLLDVRRRFQVVFQNPFNSFDPKRSIGFSISEIIRLNNTNYKLDELAKKVGINPEFMDKYPSELSGGELQRLSIARALAGNPEVFILDEPTTGLDPGTRSKVWRIISKLREDFKMTIFLTTHYMEEAADADYVTILDKGRIIAEGTPLELKTQYATDVLHLYGVDELEVKKLKLPYQKIHKAFQIKVKNSAVVTKLIIKYPELFQDFELIKSTLDDVFLTVTKNKPGTDISESKNSKTKAE